MEKYLYPHPDVSESVANASLTKSKPPNDHAMDPIDEKGEDSSTSANDEKPSLSLTKPQQRVKITQFRVSPLPVSIHARRAGRFLKSLFSKTTAAPSVGDPLVVQRISPATRTVYRMVKVRRLVTSLTRLLSTKADLIGQIRKRLVTGGEWCLNNDPELYIHMGDILGQYLLHANKPHSEKRAGITDHILSLQQALAHYEWMMAQSHPIYLTQLHIQAVKSKEGRGKATLILTVLGFAVLVELFPMGKH